MVIACPRTSAKAKRSNIQFRNVREHRKIHMTYLLVSHGWQEVFSVDDCELKCDELSNTFWFMFNECFPVISVRISSRDPPFISPLVKHNLVPRVSHLTAPWGKVDQIRESGGNRAYYERQTFKTSAGLFTASLVFNASPTPTLSSFPFCAGVQSRK